MNIAGQTLNNKTDRSTRRRREVARGFDQGFPSRFSLSFFMACFSISCFHRGFPKRFHINVFSQFTRRNVLPCKRCQRSHVARRPERCALHDMTVPCRPYAARACGQRFRSSARMWVTPYFRPGPRPVRHLDDVTEKHPAASAHLCRNHQRARAILFGREKCRHLGDAGQWGEYQQIPCW